MIRIAILLSQNFAMIICGNAAHIIVNGWQNRDRFLGDIDASKNASAFGNARQTFMQDFRVEMIKM